jgi:hypothetical protein
MHENDLKVVTFKNISDFEFTPALGAMYDGRPIFGKAGTGISPNEELQFPYHVGKRLAINLAKHMLNKLIAAPTYGKGDPAQETSRDGVTDEKINKLVADILIGEYKEEKPMKESETDVLMRKYEELNKTVESLVGGGEKVSPTGFKDKQEVIAELEKREIPHDKRKSKEVLLELLA